MHFKAMFCQSYLYLWALDFPMQWLGPDDPPSIGLQTSVTVTNFTCSAKQFAQAKAKNTVAFG